MSDARCPQCNNALVPIAAVVNDPATADAVRASLALAATPKPRAAGGLGCMSIILSGSVAFAAAVIIGGISQFTLGTDYPAPGYRFGEAAIFSGIAAFIIVMVAMFSVFVWRQANNDRIYKKIVAVRYTQKIAYDNDSYCTTCHTRVAGPPATTP